VIDPWGGSFYVEALTDALMQRAWVHLQEVEALGGMAKAIETGLPKLRIEEASARRQARIDSGKEAIVGVNLHRLDQDEAIEALVVDNDAVRESQIKRLAKLRRERDNASVQAALEALTKCAETGQGNLLELAIEAARRRASLGEISFALEKVFGRHKAAIKSVSGVYNAEFGKPDALAAIRQRVEAFQAREGRRPRILVAKMGQDGHDRGAKVVATAYADMGFDVDIGPLFQSPEETARMAVEDDVHVVGISSLAGGHKTLLAELVAELKKLNREDIMVIVGGVVPAQDYPFLRAHGAAAIFGPGTVITETAKEILDQLEKRLATK
jgi:methylmalonyl-CoA mutase